jgi:hypothetical protein
MAHFRRRRTNPGTVTFRKGGKRVVHFKRAVASAATKAAKRRRGHALAKKYGFFSKGGYIWQKRDGAAPKRIRKI